MVKVILIRRELRRLTSITVKKAIYIRIKLKMVVKSINIMWKKISILLIVFILITVGVLYVIVNPVVWKSPLKRELTPRVIMVNGNHTNSFTFKHFSGEDTYRKSNLTVIVEVLRNHYKPIEGATVIIHGYGSADINKTGKNGLATLRLQIDPSWHGDTPSGYLSMIVTKDGYDAELLPNAIGIFYG